jgi:hypothetical protein
MTLPLAEWPYLPTLIRLALALTIGLFVGVEHERRGKESGLRTFGFAALLGGLGGLLGEHYALLSLSLLVKTVLSMRTLVRHVQTVMPRVWAVFHPGSRAPWPPCMGWSTGMA